MVTYYDLKLWWKMNATEPVDLHKISISRDTSKKIEICKNILIADSFLNIYRNKSCSDISWIQCLCPKNCEAAFCDYFLALKHAKKSVERYS